MDYPGGQPDQRQGPPRLPLVNSLGNRGTLSREDARLVNAIAEKGKDGKIRVVKRPGTAVDTTLSGVGRGLFNWLGDIYAVFGTTLYKNGASLGTVDGTGVTYTFSSCLGATPTLFLQNGVKAYYYNTTAGLVAIALATTISVTCTTHTTAVIDSIVPNTTGITVLATVTGSGVPIGAYVVSIDGPNQVTISTPTTSSIAGTALQFRNADYPTSTVPGEAYLDATTYVMDNKARIYGSGLNDLATWDALNNLVAQIEPDGGVYLAKQLVYVIAFKQWSTEVFYDAGNAAGSPLAPVQGAKVNFGCRNAGTVQEVEGVLIWVSSTKAGAVGAHTMEGLKAVAIDDPATSRLLQSVDYTGCYSFGCRIGAHKLYVVTFPASNLTLCYELDSGLWSQWTDTNGNYFPFIAACAKSDQEVILQHATDGKLYSLKASTYLDAGAALPVDVYTPGWDGGVQRSKTLNRMDLVCDQTPGSVVTVRSNDNDFDATKWSQPRSMDLSKRRPYLRECGTFYTRSLHIRHVCNTAFRAEAFELDVWLGVV